MIFVEPHMQAQDELSRLFSRNLRLGNNETHTLAAEEPSIVYISQHYNPPAASAQFLEQQKQEQARREEERKRKQEAQGCWNDGSPAAAALLSPRPRSEPYLGELAVVEAVPRNYGVDASALSGSQLQLFRTAEEAQQLRLMELWRICPPTSSDDNATLAWTGGNSVEQEEIMARCRWEQKQAAERIRAQRDHQRDKSVMILDGTPALPPAGYCYGDADVKLVPASDARWVCMANGCMDSEPYMVNGYEELARREYEERARRAFVEAAEAVAAARCPHRPVQCTPATDTVYDTQQQQAMEDQYGRAIVVRSSVDEEML